MMETQPLLNSLKGITIPKEAPPRAHHFLPQAIAHRGNKAAWPENSMGGFKSAVEVGAHAIETEAKWVLLDIKLDDVADELLNAIARAFEQVASSVPWHERIVLGCWNATFITTALSLLPGFPIAHISFSTSYSRHFLAIPNLGFNMVQPFLVGPPGASFLRAVYAWTVNQNKWMEWCVRRNFVALGVSAADDDDDDDARHAAAVLIDGVITDDPKRFREVCERLEAELMGETAALTERDRVGLVASLWGDLETAWELLMVNVFGMGFFLYRRLQGRFDLLK